MKVWYNGVQYQSTTEGKWAVILDWAGRGVESRYEESGYAIPGYRGYRPDFHVLEPVSLWIEVKGAHKNIDHERMAAAAKTLTGGIVFVGWPTMPAPGTDWAWLHLPSGRYLCLATTLLTGKLTFADTVAELPDASADWLRPVAVAGQDMRSFYGPGVRATWGSGRDPKPCHARHPKPVGMLALDGTRMQSARSQPQRFRQASPGSLPSPWLRTGIVVGLMVLVLLVFYLMVTLH